ncbi:DUF4382 domain-containing protein [Pseudoduganella sp. GCM10020061]|uniref:DUF4382 domain-containing protein n=1 Tax=Pseudoduganella sp. GCM10020061 TaxID=3317345 RepID=UPI0036376BD4
MKRSSTHLGLAATAALAATLAACGGGGDAGAPAPVLTHGTLGVSLTDAPACGFDAVNVTVNKVRVHKSASAGESEAGWTDITLSPAKKINLLNLTNGVLESLGQTSLEAGKYTQLRLVLDANTGNGLANSVVPTGGAEVSLDTPSAVQSGIKLVNEFEVKGGQRVDLVLDFDACKSVVTKGGSNRYALKPVVKVIPTAINGISGYIAPALVASNVTITAQQNGNVIAATAPKTTGEFMLARLAPGNYDVVITADGKSATVIGAVPVASESSNTALSTSAAPIAMADSAQSSIGGVVTLTPASTTEAAYVAARQSFASGPLVTIRYKGADLATGAYTIDKLPVAAPQYAAYSATLPLAFAPAANVTPGAGKYRVDASATGYATKSVDAVDITTQAQSAVNFALTP